MENSFDFPPEAKNVFNEYFGVCGNGKDKDNDNDLNRIENIIQM